MRLSKFNLATGLLLGSLSLALGCKPAETGAATEGAPAASEPAKSEPATEPLGSG